MLDIGDICLKIWNWVQNRIITVHTVSRVHPSWHYTDKFTLVNTVPIFIKGMTEIAEVTQQQAE